MLTAVFLHCFPAWEHIMLSMIYIQRDKSRLRLFKVNDVMLVQGERRAWTTLTSAACCSARPSTWHRGRHLGWQKHGRPFICFVNAIYMQQVVLVFANPGRQSAPSWNSGPGQIQPRWPSCRPSAGRNRTGCTPTRQIPHLSQWNIPAWSVEYEMSASPTPPHLTAFLKQ